MSTPEDQMTLTPEDQAEIKQMIREHSGTWRDGFATGLACGLVFGVVVLTVALALK